MDDNRDWVATQHGRCAECGFDAAAYSTEELPLSIAELALRWRDAVTEAARTDPDTLRRRPAIDVWAPLEYACHVRDVVAVFTGRVERMLETDGAALGWWDHEAAPVDTAYLDQDPTVVADTIYAAGLGLSSVASRAGADGWERHATRRSGEEFTLVGLLRFGVHEMQHHLLDFASS